jgi:hypothetical protein
MAAAFNPKNKELAKRLLDLYEHMFVAHVTEVS